MTYLKVSLRARSSSSLFILIRLCCLDKFSTVLLVAAPEHKSFLFVTLISLPFLSSSVREECERVGAGGGDSGRREGTG